MLQCGWLEQHLALNEGVSKERDYDIFSLTRMQSTKQRRYVEDLVHTTQQLASQL